jgi:ATP-dependent Clp protease ATP-binding subunit ClpB
LEGIIFLRGQERIMRLDKLTEKSREALLEAQHLAEQYTHPAVEPEHLLLALLVQEGGVVSSVVRKIGGDPQLLLQSLETDLSNLPRATGSSVQVGLSRNLNAILQEAESIAEAMKDDYTSTEHLLMAMAQPKAGRIRELLGSSRHRLQRHHAGAGRGARFAAGNQRQPGSAIRSPGQIRP